MCLSIIGYKSCFKDCPVTKILRPVLKVPVCKGMVTNQRQNFYLYYIPPFGLRNALPILLLLLACSGNEKKESVSLPIEGSANEDWITYEGNVLTNHGTEVTVELSLMQGEVGLDSKYKMVVGDFEHMFNMTRGEYSILYGTADNEVIVQVRENKPSLMAVKHFKLPEPFFHDLNFKSDGANKLVLLDEDNNRVADDSRYTIYKRSRLFTIEGYITFENTRTDFYEQNTRERWIVAPLGAYRMAHNAYDSIATEQFEGVYLKALAYSVETDSTKNEVLVVKNILEIYKSKAFENVN